MMSIRKKMIAVSVLASTAVLLVFQNCTQTKFSPDAINSSLSMDGDIAIDQPVDGGGDVVLDPPADDGVNPEQPADPIADQEEPLGDGEFKLTSAALGSVVVVCNKTKVKLTAMHGAKLILVNSHLEWITGVSQGAEVQFINSTASAEVKQKHSASFKTLSSEEAAQYIEKCAALPEVAIPESTPDFMANQITLAGASQVPTMANKYSLTGVQEKVELLGLQSNSFSVTNVKEEAHVQVKTKSFRGTAVKKNARLEVL